MWQMVANSDVPPSTQTKKTEHLLIIHTHVCLLHQSSVQFDPGKLSKSVVIFKLDNVVIPKEEKKIYICAAAITHQLEDIQKKNLV